LPEINLKEPANIVRVVETYSYRDSSYGGSSVLHPPKWTVRICKNEFR